MLGEARSLSSVVEWYTFFFWVTSYRTESVQLFGLMNSTTR